MSFREHQNPAAWVGEDTGVDLSEKGLLKKIHAAGRKRLAAFDALMAARATQNEVAFAAQTYIFDQHVATEQFWRREFLSRYRNGKRV